jgi:hypothetical protein
MRCVWSIQSRFDAGEPRWGFRWARPSCWSTRRHASASTARRRRTQTTLGTSLRCPHTRCAPSPFPSASHPARFRSLSLRGVQRCESCESDAWGLARGDREWPLNDVPRSYVRGVRVALGTGYEAREEIGASRETAACNSSIPFCPIRPFKSLRTAPLQRSLSPRRTAGAGLARGDSGAEAALGAAWADVPPPHLAGAGEGVGGDSIVYDCQESGGEQSVGLLLRDNRRAASEGHRQLER